MNNFINLLHNVLWGLPLIAFIFFTGIYLTVRLRFIQFTKIKTAFKSLKSNKKEKNVSTFQAICISLSATIGTGNIIGVASAITLGGPGALFWMVISSLLGLSIKYTEGFLAIKYKNNNRKIGGPYAYIEYGMGHKFLAKCFAIFGLVGSCLGLGTFIQINGIVDATNIIIISNGENNLSIYTILLALLICIISAIVLIGGVRRIGKVCEFVVPFMAIIYIGMGIILICLNYKEVPSALSLILKLAFTKKATIGGITAYTIKECIKQGVSKGIFTNEAGLGSSPIAIATIDSSNPVKEGLASMISTFLGTVLICIVTGLGVVLTNAYQENLSGIYITEFVFSKGLKIPLLYSQIIILVCVLCFAFTSIIGWNLYAVKCLNYLTNNKFITKSFQWIYIFLLIIGIFLKVEIIWKIAEICNALMAIPNLIAIVSLSEEVIKDTNQVLKNKKS